MLTDYGVITVYWKEHLVGWNDLVLGTDRRKCVERFQRIEEVRARERERERFMERV